MPYLLCSLQHLICRLLSTYLADIFIGGSTNSFILLRILFLGEALFNYWLNRRVIHDVPQTVCCKDESVLVSVDIESYDIDIYRD